MAMQSALQAYSKSPNWT